MEYCVDTLPELLCLELSRKHIPEQKCHFTVSTYGKSVPHWLVTLFQTN